MIVNVFPEIASFSLKRHQGASGICTFHEKRAAALVAITEGGGFSIFVFNPSNFDH